MDGTATGGRHGRLSKEEGSFYTPDAVAEAIVRLSGLGRTATATSQVIDPAAGDGALLVPAVWSLARRLRGLGMADADIADAIAKNVHAIELDEAEAARCRARLSEATMAATGIEVPAGRWDVTAGDACIEWQRFRGRMDYVLMNPPYVRIHNLSGKPASPYVTGMCDLYYAFFDYAQRMLSPNGMLSAIAPSSWMTSRAGAAMRGDLMGRGAIRAVCDYGHLQVFAPYATTYTALILIGARGSDRISVWGHDGSGGLGDRTDVPSSSCWHGGLFLPGAPEGMSEMLDSMPDSFGVSVRNGYATNLDRLFVSGESRFSAYEIPVVKASRACRMHAIYPYDENGGLVPFDEIRSRVPALADLLEGERDALLARTQVDPARWWCYARTQGIADTYRNKVAIQSLVLPPAPPRTVDAPSGTGVFGGIYVTGMEKGELDEAVSSDEFLSYVRALRKYKSGGYYAFGGRDLGRFLSWWVSHGRGRAV